MDPRTKLQVNVNLQYQFINCVLLAAAGIAFFPRWLHIRRERGIMEYVTRGMDFLPGKLFNYDIVNPVSNTIKCTAVAPPDKEIFKQAFGNKSHSL